MKEEEWQPIETAPVNESVLVYLPNWEYYGHAVYKAMLVDMGTGRRWMTTAWGCGRDLSADVIPTHWTRLPEPPVGHVLEARCSCGKGLAATLSGQVLVIEPCPDCIEAA